MTAPADDPFLVGKPQNRSGIGDVEAAFARYAATRADTIALFQQQPWFKDGLSSDESLFVERTLTFLARYSNGNRRIALNPATVRDRLFLEETVAATKGEVKLLLIYEPGQDAKREMALIKASLPALEALVGVEYPERVMTIVNGDFEINDYNDGQFIRIARCCVLSAFVLTHELAHTYWSVGPSWFNEGMADIYAYLTLAELDADPPAGWSGFDVDLDAYYRQRKRLVDSGRLRDIPLPQRFTSDGLYEVADVFLLDIRRTIGEKAFAAAVRDVYLASDFGRLGVREKQIEDVFLAHAAPEQRDDVMSLFNRVIWGDNGEKYRALQERDAP